MEDMPKFSDIPKPYKRRYDDKRRKREVSVEILSWIGISFGARHFYAKVYEDDNPILYQDSTIYFSNDKESKGRSFGGVMDSKISFNTLGGATAWVINKIIEEFPNHKISEISGDLVSLSELKRKLKEAKKETCVLHWEHDVDWSMWDYGCTKDGGGNIDDHEPERVCPYCGLPTEDNLYGIV